MARILVVDDDNDILKMADQILTAAGHTVFVAADALRALDWLGHIQFDLLLSDANMPHYSGFDLINTIRKNEKYAALSIAMLTGLRERKDVERALKMGVDDYIVKPLDPLLFVEKVNALFVKKPAAAYPEIRLSGEQTRATLTRQVTVEAVSELGLTLLTEEAPKPGQVLDLKADIFAILDIASPPPVKVLRVELDAVTGMYRSHLLFMGAGEPVLQKIRRWLYQHGAAMKASA